MMESLHSLWEQTEESSRLLWIIVTVVLALFVQLAYSRRTGDVVVDDTSLTGNRTRESRLLRKQFGVIPDDLVLQSEEEEITSEKQEPSKDCDALDDSVQVQPQLSEDNAPNDSTKKNTKKSVSRPQKIRERLAGAAEARLEQQPPPFLRTTDDHPGLKAFSYWCDVESSLFRIYTVTRKDGVQDESTTPPYNPSSRRGNVAIKLRVSNCLEHPVTVYWINFKGAQIEKGKIPANGGTWRQTTWIDHPWVFCVTEDDGEERVLLHYIPYRVIPTTLEAPTVDNDDEDDSGRTGMHRFRIVSAKSDSLYSCAVDDPILPHPAADYIQTPPDAVEFALLHCVRMNYNGWNVLHKCIRMILQHPDNPQYRQIRTANRTFAEAVWNTPARGVLLAAGFVEHGAHVELGSAAPLSYDAIQELSPLMLCIEMWQKRAEEPNLEQRQQPEGADGYGRAGFGR
jgi:PUB domain